MELRKEIKAVFVQKPKFLQGTQVSWGNRRGESRAVMLRSYTRCCLEVLILAVLRLDLIVHFSVF